MGYLRCAHEVAPRMVSQGWGRIVNVSGLAARQSGSILGSIRNVSVAALSKNLADELSPHGVTVTVVHPGATRTERTSDETASRFTGNLIGRIVEAGEVAFVVAFLASPKSAAITGDAIAVGVALRERFTTEPSRAAVALKQQHNPSLYPMHRLHTKSGCGSTPPRLARIWRYRLSSNSDTPSVSGSA